MNFNLSNSPLLPHGEKPEKGVANPLTRRIESAVNKARQNEKWSNLVICQADFRNDFDMYFRKKGNFNRPIFKEKHRFV